MSDKELLELAAKAAGVEVLGVSFEMDGSFAGFPIGAQKVWNPLADDGDALRLMVKLRMGIHFGDDWGTPVVNVNSYPVALKDDPYAATRRAIVRAAAEIGRSHD